MDTSIRAKQRVRKAIDELIVEAKRRRDSRSESRYPFFRRVSIDIGGVSYSAFSREISECGIGLLHDVELMPGEVEVAIPTEKGNSVRIHAQIVWCEPCGLGWFISGGQFVGTVPDGR